MEISADEMRQREPDLHPRYQFGVMVEEAGRFAEEREVGWIELKTFWPNERSMAFWRALGFNPRVVQLVAPTGGVRTASRE